MNHVQGTSVVLSWRKKIGLNKLNFGFILVSLLLRMLSKNLINKIDVISAKY